MCVSKYLPRYKQVNYVIAIKLFDLFISLTSFCKISPK